MATNRDRKFWKLFIEKYRSLPELWQVSSKLYRQKHVRNVAWQKLLVVLQQVEPDATIEIVKRRINNIRTCYRRELNKRIKSELECAVPGEDTSGDVRLYEPSLWYFSELEFIRDQETNEEIQFSDDGPEPEAPSFEIVNVVGGIDGDESEIIESPMKKKKKFINTSLPHDIRMDDQKATKVKENEYRSEKDDATIYAESWAVSYRKLNEQQKLFAKKAIEEIFIFGQLNQLTLCSVQNPNSIDHNSTRTRHKSEN